VLDGQPTIFFLFLFFFIYFLFFFYFFGPKASIAPRRS